MKRQLVSLKKCKHPRYKYRVTYRQGESYEQKYFVARTGPDGADAFVDEKKVELLNEGRKHADFSDAERKAVIRARELAESFAESGVKGFTLDSALSFYAAHLNARRRSATVLAGYDEFVETRTKEGVSAVHLKDFKYRLEPFAKKYAKRLIVEMSTKDVDAWLFSLKCAPQTRANHRRLLHNFFGFARGRGYCDENPVSRAAKVKLVRKAPGILSPADAAVLLAACPAEIVPAVAIGLFAGLRTAEIARLDWHEIDLQRGYIEVTAENAKSSQRRIVSITPNLRAWLLPHAKHSGPVRLSEERHKIRFEAARVAAGIHVWPNNAARHSYASYHLALHEDSARTSSQLGHTNNAVLYRHYREIARPEDGKDYFDIMPNNVIPANVIPMEGAA